VRKGAGVYRRIIEPTPFGPVSIIWNRIDGRPKVVEVLLSRPGSPAEDRAARRHPGSLASSCAEIDKVADEIERLLEGEDVEIALDVADLGSCSTFQRSVLRANHGIPKGTVSTYGLVAAHLGKPDAARAVGNALAANPVPLIVPCHRVIRADRQIGGFGEGPEMKRALLEMEGLPFDNERRVVGARLHYEQGA
jgi:methylated-DNA-[protein]-cysteine S-methyltransferase